MPKIQKYNIDNHLKYKGEIVFDSPLSESECIFLNSWQSHLNKLYKKNEFSVANLSSFLNVEVSPEQAKLLYNTYSPHISFENDKIILSGDYSKGNLRGSLLAYHHLFLKKDSFFSDIFRPIKFTPHSLKSGFIEGLKFQDGKKTQWCYIIENNDFFSIDAVNKNDYLSNKNFHDSNMVYKKDSYEASFLKYFPEMIKYNNLLKSIDLSAIRQPTKRNKI